MNTFIRILGVGHKVLDMLEYRKNGKIDQRTHSHEYSRIFYNRPQNESEHIHTNIGSRTQSAGYAGVQEEWEMNTFIRIFGTLVLL